MADAPNPRRRLRFSLRTLLALMAVVAVVVGYQANQIVRRRHTLEELKVSASCDLFFESQYPRGRKRGPKWLADLLGVDLFDNIAILELELYPDRTLPDLTALGEVKKLILRADGLDEVGVKRIAALPHLVNLVLYLPDNKPLTDESFLPLAQLKHLEQLMIVLPKPKERFTGKCLAFAGALPRLRSLQISIQPSELAAAIDAIRSSQSLERLTLDLAGTYRDEDVSSALAPLADLTSLKSLGVYNNTGKTLRPLAGLGRLVGLNELAIYDAAGESLADLAPLEQLESLEVAAMPDLTDEGLSFIANLPKLTDLELRNCPRVSLKGFRGGRQLTNLTIDSCELTDETFAGLGDVPNLRHLTLRSLPRLSMAALPVLPRLQSLVIQGETSLGNTGFAHPENVPALSSLFFDYYEVSDTLLEEIVQINSLETLSTLRLTKATDGGLRVLAGAKRLKFLQLRLPRQSQVTEQGLDQLKRALPNCYLSIDRD